jgi:hypothetical protein
LVQFQLRAIEIAATTAQSLPSQADNQSPKGDFAGVGAVSTAET